MKVSVVVIPSIFLVLSIILGCEDSSSAPENPDELIDEHLITENYPGFVFNEANNQPVSNLKIQFSQLLGDSFIYGIDTAITDDNGFFNIDYAYDPDTLWAVASRNGLDTSSISHRLELVTEEYLLITTLQNGEPLPVFRPRLIPNEVIDVNVYSAGMLQIEMADTTNTDLYDQVDVHFTLLNPFPILFDLTITNDNENLKRFEILLPAGLDVLMETTILEGADANSLSEVETRADTLNLAFQEKLNYVITH